MIRSKFLHERILLCCTVAVILGVLIAPAGAAEKTIHLFQGGSDGIAPWGLLISDKADNLYGVTAGGGGGTGCRNGSDGCGTLFIITPDHTETVLHAFAGGCDGAFPRSGPIADNAGNMYGTTQGGGTCGDDLGFGTIYKIARDGTESVLYAFKNDANGADPTGGLIMDKKGNLYGNANGGGGTGCNGGGCGLVYKLSPDGDFSVVYNFGGGSDGAGPDGGLILDKAGNLYGTTATGGGSVNCQNGCGTVFKLTPDGTETVLYAFQGGSDGWLPQNGVAADSAGNLYGSTLTGGSGVGNGTVFKVTPDGTETVLHSFQGGTDGGDPQAGVILDKQGNIYGTTYFGGDPGCKKNIGCGVVYKLTPKGKETVLLAFNKNRGGRNPSAGLLLGKHGDLYGTTLNGGKNKNGVVFQVKK